MFKASLILNDKLDSNLKRCLFTIKHIVSIEFLFHIVSYSFY